MIFIASDHAGFYLKKALIQYLHVKEYEVEDCGAFKMDEADDYPDFIIPCALRVAKSHARGKLDDVGIVIGASGNGEAIAANKVKGIRAAVFYGANAQVAVLAKSHNNANILSIGARFTSEDEAKAAVAAWLDAEFANEERHVRRIEKIRKIDEERG